MMSEPRRALPWQRSTKPMVAGGLALTWSACVTLLGLALLVALPLVEQESRDGGYCESIDHPGDCADLPELLIPGLVVMGLGAWCSVASVGLIRRRRWARPAVAATFLLWALPVFGGLVVSVVREGLTDLGSTALTLALLTWFLAVVFLTIDPTGVDRQRLPAPLRP